MEYAFKVTANGRAIIAACAALEEPLRITRAAVGSGDTPEGTDLADIHELYHYVTDGAINELRHEKDRLYLTVQYTNRAHPEVPTFYLSEFMVYAQDPETGEETDLLYATLGDYRQAVPKYRAEFPACVFNYPMIIVISDEIQVDMAAAPGIVTFDDIQRLCADGVIGISRREITIPAEGWQEGEGESPEFAGYTFHADVSVENAKAQMTPVVTIYPSSMMAAGGLCPAAETQDGGVRFYAKAAPREDIKASLALLGGSGYIGPSGGGGDIQPATTGTIGGVIVGEGLNVDIDGRLSVDRDKVLSPDNIAADEDVQQDITEILSGDNG